MPKHCAAFTTLEHGLLEQSGITVITGAVGSGKTTPMRWLLTRLNRDELTVGVIDNGHGYFVDLLERMTAAF